jgi:soluble lytic murein transglycosylase-like protein
MNAGLILIGTALVLFFFMFQGKLFGSSKITSLKKTIVSEYDLNGNLVEAIIKVESSGNPEAVNPDGPSYGLMQITPALAQDYGLIKDYRMVNPNDIVNMMNPENNLRVGCWFLSRLLKKYSRDVAIQMYNVGETGYNNGARAGYYLSKVLSYYNKLEAENE